MIDYARNMAARGQRDWYVCKNYAAPAEAVWDDPGPGAFLTLPLMLLERGADEEYTVTPHGLAQPLREVIRTWKVERPEKPPAYVIGNAGAVARFCARIKVPLDNASVVSDVLCSGTHVWIGEGERLVEARWVR